MNSAADTPLDVKLMNGTAALLFVGFVVLAVVAGGKWLGRLQVFAIQGITVAGDMSHNSPLTLRANVAPGLSGTFFSVDLARVRAAFEAVPWVRHAVVRREFPNRLRVELQEHVAVAYWGDEPELRLLNSFGEVFEANVGEVEQEELPKLSGPDGESDEVLQMYRTLAPSFAGMELELEQLELSDRGSWRARLDGGAVIELGRGGPDVVVERLQQFLKTLTQVTSRYGRGPGSLESADLRHVNGYAVKLRGVTTLAAADSGKK
ncbi:cell division protein FtsQ/DivIB [Rhodoferax sp. TBRC 17198]|uniref:cell division protein FtsQ/DivIB n=1 Tax=Rhodoferax potami TaxID=3068338 RepID=UPI0028BDA828|nr:cell division protein FtsQ/DivIB [Rhodoferax sp. TBRC 17198]MDT7523295.1 cell division protein FtsQ/DivIB [Rhodoferax sp. TBRC 17198]